jgi:voltage-gated potassium channel
LWAVSTTVGLGDVTAVTVVGRVAAMLCSLYAIITTALITGVIVDYFNESRQRQFDESLTEFLDKLERLPELSNEELEAISRRVRELR